MASSTIAGTVSLAIMGRIGAISGEVVIIRALGEQIIAKEGDALYEDDVLSTQSGAAALVHAESGNVLTLGHAAAVQFNPSLVEIIDREYKSGSLGLGESMSAQELQAYIANGGNIQTLLTATSGGSITEESDPKPSKPSYQPPTSESPTFNSDLVVVWHRADGELVPTSGYKASDPTQEVDFFGNQIASNPLSGVDDELNFSGNTRETEQVAPQDSAENDGAPIAANDNSDNTVNNLPSASDEAFSVDEDNILSGLLTASDTDGDQLVFNTTPISNVSNGSLAISANGTFSYTPNANFNGVDSFTYEVSDGRGGTTQATVTITVNAVTDIPTAVADSYSMSEDSSLITTLMDDLLNNDSHGDGASLSVNTTPVSNVSNGVLILNSDGTFTYTPNSNFNGVDSFVYEVSDGNGGTAQATATITVGNVVDLSTNSEVETTNEDTSIVSTVSTGDSTTSGGSLSYTLVSGPSHGTFSSPINSTTGSYTYTPNADYVGSDSFQYLVTDSASGESSVETVSITINPVADLSGTDDTLSVPYNTLTAGDVSSNDSTTSSGGNDNLTFAKQTDPEHGILVFNSDGTYTYNPTGIGIGGGSDSFTYLVTDPASGESSIQTVNITIDPANTPPEGTDGSATIDEDTSYTLLVADFGFSDVVDGDSFKAVRIDTLPSAGSLTLAGIAVTAGQIISVTAIAAGDLVFTPAADGNGTPYSSFTFSVQDSADSIDTTPNTFTLNVTPTADVPIAQNDSYDVVVNTPFSATLANGVLLNDSDADGDSLTVNTTPISDVSNGVLILNADGTFTYTPNADFNGSDSFTYEIDDGTGNTTQATVNISVDYVSDTIFGTDANDNLIGAAESDDDIYSGGVGPGYGSENIQGVAGTIIEAQSGHVGSGNDRLIFDADDAYVDNAGSTTGGHLRIRDFTVGDVTTDTDADTLVLGDFLRAGDPSFDGTAADAVRFLHFSHDKLLYIDREGGLGEAGSDARTLNDGSVYHGITGGASLFLEFKGVAFDSTPTGETLNTEAQIQKLMDLGFLDFS